MEEHAAPSAGHRIPQLDGLRAVAILAVFIHHSTRAPLLWAGVDVFFVLSGFLITGILLNRKASGGAYFQYFYWRRIFRILPAYLVALVLYGTFFSWYFLKPWWMFAFFGMNIQPFFHPWPEQLPVWSLAVEEQFYLVWPVVVLFVSERTLLWLAAAAVVTTPILRFLCAPFFHNQFGIYSLTPFRADLLCAGAILALLWKRRDPTLESRFRRFAPIGCVAGFGALAAAQLWTPLRLASNTRWSNTFDYSFSLVGSACLLAWALADRGTLRRLLVLPPMRYLGRISYSVYLVHLMVIAKLGGNRPWIRVALPAFAVTLAYATISWFVLEQPLLRFAARRRFPARRTELPMQPADPS